MILIIADANEQIGTGHIMRCISIATALSQLGEEVLFITADHNPDLILSHHGFHSVCLDSKYTDFDNGIDTIKKIINQLNARMLIVDSYYVTNNFFAAVSQLIKTVYIDDYNSACWDIHYLINYNIYASDYDYSQYKPEYTKLLLTPYYAPLRKEFVGIPKNPLFPGKPATKSAFSGEN